MLKDITLGQYFPGKSIVHRADPRTKIVLVMLFIFTLFFVRSWPSYGIILLYLALVIANSKISPKLIFRGLKPLIIIIAFTGVFNLFYTPGRELFSVGFVTVTWEGVETALFLVIRIVLLVIGSSMLTYTTAPIDLTDGLERLLSPLGRLHVPVHELAMMMSIALRFIPTLVEETEKIMNAQKARGADFESGNLLERGKALVPILVPLFISAFRRAEELATAMECRLYHGGEGRTRMRQLRLTRADAAAAAFSALLFSAAVVVNQLL
ncbi:MAG: energy-coupling factor transporter transmembrane component T family protein [Butyricicoccaceae bacterium]